MNRRSFIKLLGLTALAISLPIDILVDNRDDETKMLEELLNSVNDELVVLSFIKEHLNTLRRGDPLHIVIDEGVGYMRLSSPIIMAFQARQPNLMKWLKDRITKDDIADKNSRFSKYKNKPFFEDIRWTAYNLYHKHYAPKYPQFVVKHFNTKEEWMNS